MTANWLVLVLQLFVVSQAFAQEREVVLQLGEERIIDLPDIAKEIDLSDADVVGISKSGSKARILISAKKRGMTLATFRLADTTKISYRIRVGSRFGSAKSTLENIKGLNVSERGSQLVVKGELYSRADVQTVKRIKAEYTGVIIDMTEQRLAETNTVVRTINRILIENDLGNIQAHAYGKILALEGSAKDQEQAELALRIARLITPAIENRIDKKSNGAPAISIEVMFVEVNNTNDKTIGFGSNLGEKGDNPSIAKAYLAPKSGTVSSGKASLAWQVGGLFSFLQLIEDRSFSRVLSNPRLVARSGSKATFHSGETKYLTNTQVQDNLMVTNYLPVNAGIILSIVPQLDAIGQIDSEISTEVSEFRGQGNDNLPSLSKSSLDTAVTIKDGETVMLSGLVRKRNSKNVHRVPILADIPLVGELFKSRHTVDANTEMVILVTMKRVQKFSERIQAAGQKLWQRAEDGIEFSFSD